MFDNGLVLTLKRNMLQNSCKRVENPSKCKFSCREGIWKVAALTKFAIRTPKVGWLVECEDNLFLPLQPTWQWVFITHTLQEIYANEVVPKNKSPIRAVHTTDKKPLHLRLQAQRAAAPASLPRCVPPKTWIIVALSRFSFTAAFIGVLNPIHRTQTTME